jgi:hypothetical protein
MTQCTAIKADGHKCRSNAKHGSVFCAVHLKKLTAAGSQATTSSAIPASSGIHASGGIPAWPAPIVRDRDDDVISGGSDMIPGSHSCGGDSDLSQVLSEILNKMDQLTVAINKKSKGRAATAAPVDPSSKRALVLAKWAFYNKYKNDPAVVAEIQPKLESVGLLIHHTSMSKDGKVVTEVRIPYHYKKIVTDEWFDSLSHIDKETWCREAVASRH